MSDAAPQLIFFAVVVLLALMDGIARSRRKVGAESLAASLEHQDGDDEEGDFPGAAVRPGPAPERPAVDGLPPPGMEQILRAALAGPSASTARPHRARRGSVVLSPEHAVEAAARPEADHSKHLAERSGSGPTGSAPAPDAGTQVRALLGGTHAELRRAVLLHDILGPPKGLVDDPTES